MSDSKLPGLGALLASKFTCTVFGVPYDFTVNDRSVGEAMGLAAGQQLHLVSVKCVQLEGLCQKVNLYLLLPGAGEPVLDSEDCCCRAPNIRKWVLRPDMQLPQIDIKVSSLSQLVSAKTTLSARGLYVALENVQYVGTTISANLVWRLSELGIGGSYPLSYNVGVPNPYIIPIFDNGWVQVNAEIETYLSERRVCARLRARWLGGNIGSDQVCVRF